MKNCVLIFEWNRPRFLKICVDSIRAAKDPWPTVICIDGCDQKEAMRPFADDAEVLKIFDDHVGNLWHVVRSLKHAVNLGYDRMLFIDGDMIVRTDIFEMLKKAKPEWFVQSMESSLAPATCWFSPLGNVIMADNASKIVKYAESKEWVGLSRPGHEMKMSSDYPGYDAVFCRYMVDNKLMSQHQVRSYVGHIGISGVDNDLPHMIDEMFEGKPSKWLANAIRLFNPADSKAFVPLDFIYE